MMALLAVGNRNGGRNRQRGKKGSNRKDKEKNTKWRNKEK
jgi:hypothetical protein